MGLPLHRIRDIRVLYAASPWGESLIPFETYVFTIFMKVITFLHMVSYCSFFIILYVFYLGQSLLFHYSDLSQGFSACFSFLLSRQFKETPGPVPKGHVIAARITAENPDEVCLFHLLALLKYSSFGILFI